MDDTKRGLKVDDKIKVTFGMMAGIYEAKVIGFDKCLSPCPIFKIEKPILFYPNPHLGYNILRKL